MVRAMRCRDFWICVKSRVPHSATEMLLMTTSQIPLGTFNRSHPDCGPVCIWHGQSSVYASPNHVVLWVVFSVCQPQSCTQTVVLSGMGSLQCVPALVMYLDCGPVGSVQCVPAPVMYPDCGLVWHGQSCTLTVGLSGMGSLQCVPALVMYPDCGPVWHG